MTREQLIEPHTLELSLFRGGFYAHNLLPRNHYHQTYKYNGYNKLLGFYGTNPGSLYPENKGHTMSLTKKRLSIITDKQRAIALNLTPEPPDTKVYDRGDLKHWKQKRWLFD